jgi:SAM-dependent methyltransferase
MGLGRALLADLIELKRAGALDGCSRVVDIGAQQLADSFLTSSDLLTELYGLFGRPPIDLGRPIGNGDFATQAPAARRFWQSLGFEYASIDLAAEHDAIPINLNSDTVPQDWRGCFDLVINAGTTEHVANQDNAFRILHDLTRPGGLMYHEVPAFTFGHGLLNYSPKFFIQLLRQNDYDAVFIRACKSEPEKIPRYIAAMNRRWGKGHQLDVTDMPAITMRAALIKRGASDFVTPLDLPRSMTFRNLIKTDLSMRSLRKHLPLR